MNTRRILVVDDVPAITRVYDLFLTWCGYRIRTVNDSRMALEAVREFKPNAVLLDIAMPHLDGYQVAAQIRNEQGLETLPLIAITSFSDDVHLERAKQVGIHHSFVKPCNLDEVQRLLEEYCKV